MPGFLFSGKKMGGGLEKRLEREYTFNGYRLWKQAQQNSQINPLVPDFHLLPPPLASLALTPFRWAVLE